MEAIESLRSEGLIKLNDLELTRMPKSILKALKTVRKLS
jgi:hypothetical protein